MRIVPHGDRVRVMANVTVRIVVVRDRLSHLGHVELLLLVQSPGVPNVLRGHGQRVPESRRGIDTEQQERVFVPWDGNSSHVALNASCPHAQGDDI